MIFVVGSIPPREISTIEKFDLQIGSVRGLY